MVTEVLAASYETLITKDYGAKLLEEALPLITRPSPDLLTCGTWYVVLHPETQDLVLAAAVGPRRNRQNATRAAIHACGTLRHIQMGVARQGYLGSNLVRFDKHVESRHDAGSLFDSHGRHFCYESLRDSVPSTQSTTLRAHPIHCQLQVS